jgi:hypothetical protein
VKGSGCRNQPWPSEKARSDSRSDAEKIHAAP